MSDLISRRALREILEMRNMIELYPEWRTLSLGMKEKIGRLAKAFRKAIDSAPTSDAVPVVHARWIAERERMGHYSHCSKCECRCQGYAPNYKYCPNCGAKMDAKEER